MYGMSRYLGLERTQDVVIKFLNTVQRNKYLTRVLNRKYGFKSELLETNVLGLNFQNPIGVAAGFDKRRYIFEDEDGNRDNPFSSEDTANNKSDWKYEVE
jgi:hypothetical protein